jgi:hypothetical protein
MRARMLLRRTGSVLVIRQGTEPATEHEWRGLLTELGQQDLTKLRILIATDGGGPTAEQRAAIKVVMAGRSVRTAVVSDSIKVRFAIATIALINREHHGFTSRELSQAYDFLQLTPAERGDTDSVLRQLGDLLAQ